MCSSARSRYRRFGKVPFCHRNGSLPDPQNTATGLICFLTVDVGCSSPCFFHPCLPTPQGHCGTCQERTRWLAAGTARDSREPPGTTPCWAVQLGHTSEQTPAVPVPRLKPLRFYRVLIHLDSNPHRLHAPELCSHTSHITIKTGIYQ